MTDPFSGMPTADDGDFDLDVVICTYNNAPMLERTLNHLADQEVAGVRWRVLVVDNNCTDGTADRVDRHVETGWIPHLRRVVETDQGLTPARRRGVEETTADWIAFVDDDCLLRSDWIANAAEFARNGPACGGFGGRVELEWETPPPPGLNSYGSIFAEQEYGDERRVVLSLVGAGMVLNRRALEMPAWLQRPLLDDRVGSKLSTCGDLEIALRIRSAGYPLWYEPRCHLQHVMPPKRTHVSHLMPLASELGVGAMLTGVMTAPPTGLAWARRAAYRAAWFSSFAARRTVGSFVGRRTRLSARIDRRFAAGAFEGIWRLLRMPRSRRHELVGSANGIPDLYWRL